MSALANRPRRLVLACALITAVTLGTVTASAATASEPSGTPSASPGTDRPPIGAGSIGVAYAPTDDAPDDVNEANKAFARCMRGEGQQQFPDFHAVKADDGSVRLQVKLKGGDFNPVTKKYRAAVKKCAPLLKEAGITFPATPGSLPGRPGRPGKGKGERIEPGAPEGLPSLTGATKNA
ncbi:hypothetical protein ACFWP7_09855 [Streptomyces sp. NPDC058470]|uniref:hypothetical protein n=1 Tax=Streptomyces sp. NPDC058470 TaxID=3346515 RepID=UPI00364BF58E